MKVWLDDVRPLPYDYDIHVKSYKHAITLICAGIVTEISLDNDLGDVYWDGSPTGEGRHVADYIEGAAYIGMLSRIKWYIHTSNTVARSAMEAALKNADTYWTNSESK